MTELIAGDRVRVKLNPSCWCCSGANKSGKTRLELKLDGRVGIVETTEHQTDSYLDRWADHPIKVRFFGKRKKNTLVDRGALFQARELELLNGAS